MERVLDVGVQPGGLYGHAFGGLNYKSNAESPNLVVKVPCTLQQLYTGANKMVNYNRKVFVILDRLLEAMEEQQVCSYAPNLSI